MILINNFKCGEQVAWIGNLGNLRISIAGINSFIHIGRLHVHDSTTLLLINYASVNSSGAHPPHPRISWAFAHVLIPGVG